MPGAKAHADEGPGPRLVRGPGGEGGLDTIGPPGRCRRHVVEVAAAGGPLPPATAVLGRWRRRPAACCRRTPPQRPLRAAAAACEGCWQVPTRLRAWERGRPPSPAAVVPGLAAVLEADGLVE